MIEKPIPVLYGIARLGIGGAERQLYELARRVARYGYRPMVFALEAEGVFAEKLVAAQIPVFALSRGFRLDPRPVYHLRQILRRSRVQIVHSFGFYAGLYGRLAAAWAGTPIRIHSERATRAWLRALRNPLYFALDRRLSRSTDLIIANAQAVKAFAVDTKRIPAENVRVVYNGIDDEWFRPVSPVQAAEVKQRYGWCCTEQLVGIVARLDPMKDHRTLLKAAQIVLAAHPAARFVIVGDGMLRAELQAFACALGIQDRVAFMGTIAGEDLQQLVAALDVVVLSSREGEGCSNAILEAMALCKPVVATDVGGNAELVVDQQTGILVPPEEPALLGRAIDSLLGDDMLRQTMGRLARSRAESEFSVDKMTEATVALYSQLLQHRL
jgi:glycosyltransferase involved in cell wall biosynthesis